MFPSRKGDEKLSGRATALQQRSARPRPCARCGFPQQAFRGDGPLSALRLFGEVVPPEKTAARHYNALMSTPVPRYLVGLHPKRVLHYFTDVLVIGGGLSGLRAAIEIDAGHSVVVVAKGDLRHTNSIYAQGGIAGVMDPEDCFEDHIADTLRAGGDLCDPAIVGQVVREAPVRIQELMEWGTHFDRRGGELLLGREGGHRHHRIVHALGDATGKEVMRAVVDWVEQKPNVQLWRQVFTIDLLVHEGVCRGAVVWNLQHGKMIVWAKQTILCTGGAGQLYRESTNPAVATGDGIALAYRAGAELRDMEFMQFHPRCSTSPAAAAV